MENPSLIATLVASNTLLAGILVTAFWKWVSRIEEGQRGKADKTELNDALSITKKRLDDLEKDRARNESARAVADLRWSEVKSSVELLRQGTELQMEHIVKSLDTMTRWLTRAGELPRD